MELPAGGQENCPLADTRSAFPIDRCLGGSTTGALLLGVLSVLKHPTTEEEHVRSDEEIMEILEHRQQRPNKISSPLRLPPLGAIRAVGDGQLAQTLEKWIVGGSTSSTTCWRIA